MYIARIGCIVPLAWKNLNFPTKERQVGLEQKNYGVELWNKSIFNCMPEGEMTIAQMLEKLTSKSKHQMFPFLVTTENCLPIWNSLKLALTRIGSLLVLHC